MSDTETAPLAAYLSLASRRALGWCASHTDAALCIPADGESDGVRWHRMLWCGGTWHRYDGRVLRQGDIVSDIATEVPTLLRVWLLVECEESLYPCPAYRIGSSVLVVLPSDDHLLLPPTGLFGGPMCP